MRFFLLIFIISITTTNCNLDRKQHFCGRKLSDTLNEVCLIHNSPKFEFNRYRRQIVDECCKLPCTKRYLIEFYCYKPRRKLLNSKRNHHQKNEFELTEKTHQIGRCKNCKKRTVQKIKRKQSRRVRLKKYKAPNIGYVEHYQQPVFVDILAF